MISNCKRCGKVFQKHLKDTCVDCLNEIEEHVRVLYKHLQRSQADGGIAIDKLAEDSGIDVEMIWEYYENGQLGTASAFLRTYCKGCGTLMKSIQRFGKYCVACSHETADQAGVRLRTNKDIEREDAETAEKAQMAQMLKSRRANQQTRFGRTR